MEGNFSLFSRCFRPFGSDTCPPLCVAIYRHQYDNKTEGTADGEFLQSRRDVPAFHVFICAAIDESDKSGGQALELRKRKNNDRCLLREMSLTCSLSNCCGMLPFVLPQPVKRATDTLCLLDVPVSQRGSATLTSAKLLFCFYTESSTFPKRVLLCIPKHQSIS